MTDERAALKAAFHDEEDEDIDLFTPKEVSAHESLPEISEEER